MTWMLGLFLFPWQTMLGVGSQAGLTVGELSTPTSIWKQLVAVAHRSAPKEPPLDVVENYVVE
jgi:hypothetical protein